MGLSKTQANITIGDRRNKQQALVGIPAGPDGEDPGCLVLEGVNADASTYNRLYLWAASDNTLHYSTTEPSDEDADGTALDGTLIAGASTKALDNLSGVAINTTLASDTNVTDDLGTSSIYWKDAYIQDVYFGAAEYISGTTSNKLILEATTSIEVGANDNGVDFILHGATASTNATWDESADSLIFTDAAFLTFGNSSDITINWDATDLAIEAAADDSVVAFGKASDVDVRFVSHDNSNQDAGWISDIYTFQICNNALLQFGGAAFDTVTDGFQLLFDGDSLRMDAVTANDTFRIGETTATDVQIDGGTAGYDITWDASANTWTFLDSTLMAFGSSDDITFSYDGTNNELDILGSGKTILFGVNNTGIDVKWFGDTDGDYMMWDQSADQLLFEDATIGIAGANVTYTLGISTDELLITGTDHANNGVTFGAASQTHSTDVTLQTATSGDHIVFDAGSKTLTFTDCSAVFDYDNGTVSYTFVADSSDYLTLSADDAAAARLQIGTASGTNGMDVVLLSTTSGDTVTWDAANKDLVFEDSSIRVDGANVNYSWDISTDSLALTATDHANAKYIIGSSSGTNSIDLVLQSGTSGDTITFDGAGKTLTFVDCAAVFDYDNGTVSYTIDADSNDYLTLDADDAAAARLVLGASGGTHGMDVYFQSITAGDTIVFDAASKTLTFTDVSISLDYDNGTETYNISNNSSDKLLIDALDDTAAGELIIGTTGTNGLDFTLQTITSGDFIKFDAGAKTLTSTDCEIIALVGTAGAGLAIPYHATTSPSGTPTTGSIYYEVDTHKLWVHEGSGTWANATLS